MKFTNVSAIVALLSIGACAAVKDVTFASEAIATAFFDKPDTDLKALKIQGESLSAEEITAIGDKKDAVAIKKALEDVAAEEAKKKILEDKVAAILDPATPDLKTRIDALKDELDVSAGHTDLLVSIAKWDAPLTEANVRTVLALDEVKAKKDNRKFVAKDMKLAKILAAIKDTKYADLSEEVKVIFPTETGFDASEENVIKAINAADAKKFNSDVDSVKRALTDSADAAAATAALKALQGVTLTANQITALVTLDKAAADLDDKVKVIMKEDEAESGSMFTAWNIGFGIGGVAVLAAICYAGYHFTQEKMDDETDL